MALLGKWDEKATEGEENMLPFMKIYSEEQQCLKPQSPICRTHAQNGLGVFKHVFEHYYWAGWTRHYHIPVWQLYVKKHWIVVIPGPQRMNHKVLLSCAVKIIPLNWQSGLVWLNNQFVQSTIGCFYVCVAALNRLLIQPTTRDVDDVLQTF